MIVTIGRKWENIASKQKISQKKLTFKQQLQIPVHFINIKLNFGNI